MSDEDLWRRAEETMGRIRSGKLKATDAQIQRLQALIEGHEAYLQADTELRRGMLGLLYEKHIYLSKMWLLEKLGVSNNWGHPLLEAVRDIIYRQSPKFKRVDFMGGE